MKNAILFMAGAVALAVGVAVAAEEEDPVWTMELRTPWLTPAREIMNLGGEGAGWKATYTEQLKGEYLRKAGWADVFHWTDGPVDEKNAKWVDVLLPRPRFRSDHHSHCVGHFRRTFVLSDAQVSRDVRINFESIGQHFKVWVNGRLAADEPQSSGYLETFDISSFVHSGTNTLRIMTAPGYGEDHSWLDWPLLDCRDDIARPMYLEFRDKIAIEKAAVRTQVEPEKVMTVLVTVTNMTNASVAREVKVKVEGEQWNALASVELKPGEGKVVELKKPWPEAKLWSPADPHLYNLTVSLGSKNRTIKQSNNDSYKVRFGFREIRWVGTNRRILLNGKPFTMLRTTYGQYGHDKAKNFAEFEKFRRRGFVGTRLFLSGKGGCFDFARVADAADEYGWLIATALPSGWGGGFKTEVFWPRWRRAIAKMMDAGMNSPSVICWGLSNEFGTVYGGGDPKKPENFANAVRQGEVGEWVQRCDPTRPWECYGEIELRWHGNEGPMPIRSCHYPVPVSGNVLPQCGRWYAEGRSGWQGAFTNDKPVSISEDLYHGFQDSHPTVAKALVGDRVYTVDGYVDALWYGLRCFAEGYYGGAVAAWDPWAFYASNKKNDVYDGPKGSPHPFYMFALKEFPRNVPAGRATPYTLLVFNKWFAPFRGTYAWKSTAGGRIVDEGSAAIALDAGGTREIAFAVKAPEAKGLEPMTLELSLKDEGGKVVQTDSFEFCAVPDLALGGIAVPDGVAALVTASNSPLRSLRFPKGVHARAAQALAATPGAIVVHGRLLPQDEQMLDDWVKTGGRVLQLEAKADEPCVAVVTAKAPHAFAFSRDDARMRDIPEVAMRTWAPDGLVGEMLFPKPKGDAKVLWEAVHLGGQKWASTAWFWRGKGGWLVSTLPVLERAGVEPAATHVLRFLLGELADGMASVPKRALALVDFGGRRMDGTNVVADVKTFFDANGFRYRTLTPAAARAERPGSWVFVVDGHGTNLTTEVKAFVRAVGAAKGGKVLVLDMGRDTDPEWLDYLGIAWEEAPQKIFVRLPWDLPTAPANKEVDQLHHWFVRKGNSGLIAGVNNEDLFWWKDPGFKSFFDWRWAGHNPPIKIFVKVGEPVRGYFRATAGGTRILTEPGAIGVRADAGEVVFSTIAPTDKDFAANFPEKVSMTIRTLLNNMGAVAMPSADTAQYECLDLSELANVSAWRAPGAEKLCFAGGDARDFRYFPVNRCGWSTVANNFCPVEEFPDVPIAYDGVLFRFINPARNGGRDFLFGKAWTLKLPRKMKVGKVHFLGAGVNFVGPAKVRFGESAVTTDIVRGDHVGHYADGFDSVKRGRKVYNGIWDIPPAERKDAATFKAGRVFAYRWTIDNPDPDREIDRITVSDAQSLAIFAVTIEK